MDCGASVIIPNVLSFLLSIDEVAEESEEDESEDEEAGELYEGIQFDGFGGLTMGFFVR